MSEVTKELILKIQPMVIDHLGIKMYQKPVDVIAEFIANAWDADAERVDIVIDNEEVAISDSGNGMSFVECQQCYLTVGRNRRKATNQEVSEFKHRPVLGRKGIGKFAGFGVAKLVDVESISVKTGERTAFRMDIDAILDYDNNDDDVKKIEVTIYEEGEESRKPTHGTKVVLRKWNVALPSVEGLRKELSRRFLLSQTHSDFVITVNGEVIPDGFNEELEFVFPRDLTDDERAKYFSNLSVDESGWAKEPLEQYSVKWRMGFFESPIQVEELRGISIFAKGKMAQKPFFFELSGGISGQNALEYMTGQVQMDFIDEADNDLIATERQRINLQTELGLKIKDWGIEKVKRLGSIWKSRRSEKRMQELNDKVSGFRGRLDNLPSFERKTVESVLKKIASFERLGKARFTEWCDDILTSWENGRLRELISKIDERNDLDETRLLEILSEAQVLTSLNIAEAIRTKVAAIGELKRLVETKELETRVRDYIYSNPWIVNPIWESYTKEESVKNLIKRIADENLKNDEVFNGRVDLALSAGSDLLIIEFMRPGLMVDKDHLDRLNYYVADVRNALSGESGGTIQHADKAYLIADTIKESKLVHERIQQLSKENVFVLSWNSLIEQALSQWREHLALLKSRFPDDKRIQAL
ncbi:MAG: hypothetical protein E7046_05585 [Lentisphaerae bacterium]|nr:hypothetical protein [Lentisphaerota bacterium]